MKRKHNIIQIEVPVLRETAMAIMVEDLDGNKTWIPKSQCEYDEEGIQLPEWLAQEKRLI